MFFRVLTACMIVLAANCSLLFAESETMAPASEVSHNHVILAFDEAGTDHWRGTDESVREYVGDLLFNNGGKPLLGKDDYFTVVGIKADLSARFWKDFVYIKHDYKSNNTLAFCDQVNLAKALTTDQDRWESLAAYQGKPIENSYSLLSIANSYILARVGQVQDKPLVDKTYIIFVTDDRYNGDDYYKELQYFLGRREFYDRKIDIQTVLKVCYDVQEEYSIVYKKAKDNIPYGYRHNVELFEVVANQEYLAIPAVVSYSPSLKAVRKRGDKYSIDLTLQHINEHFDVKNMKISLLSDIDTVMVDSINDLSEYTRNIEFPRDNGFSTLRLEARLKLNDGFYDATLLTPASVKGLIQDVEIIYEKDAMCLFGLFRLPDQLWFPGIESQQVAAIVLNITILLLVIIAFALYLWKTNTYSPKYKDVSIRIYE